MDRLRNLDFTTKNIVLGRGRRGNLGFPNFVDSQPIEEKKEEKKFQSPIEKRKRQQEKSGTKYI
jgi:hypothetical protein